MSTLALSSHLHAAATAATTPVPVKTAAPVAPMLRAAPAWRPAPARHVAALATLALHLLGALALLTAGRAVATQWAPAPVQVRLVAERPQPPQPAQTLPRQTPPLPAQPVLAVPVPEFETASARAVQAQAQVQVQAQAPAILDPAPAAAPGAPQAPTPKTVAASALRYRVEPAVEVPLLSRRAGEHGRVALRVVFDAQGRPREIQLQRSSGFARLDAQALEAMRLARIQPIVEDGRAIEVMATAWLEYELD